jgi:hypothetical protein
MSERNYYYYPGNGWIEVKTYVKWLNQENITESLNIFDEACRVLDPDVNYWFYRIGDTWMEESRLKDEYPKLTQYPNWLKLFRLESDSSWGDVTRKLYYCRIPTSKMQDHFGPDKNIIDQLVQEFADE